MNKFLALAAAVVVGLTLNITDAEAAKRKTQAALDAQRTRNEKNRATEEMSYEAVWQQWLQGDDPLRARMSWALLQIFVISNIAPDIRPTHTPEPDGAGGR